MTCKDCIHEIVCRQDEVFKYGAYECTEFKSKADYVEVNHSEWRINCDGYYPYCDNCKTEPKNGVMSKYCPECGAIMDKRSAT